MSDLPLTTRIAQKLPATLQAQWVGMSWSDPEQSQHFTLDWKHARDVTENILKKLEEQLTISNSGEGDAPEVFEVSVTAERLVKLHRAGVEFPPSIYHKLTQLLLAAQFIEGRVEVLKQLLELEGWTDEQLSALGQQALRNGQLQTGNVSFRPLENLLKTLVEHPSSGPRTYKTVVAELADENTEEVVVKHELLYMLLGRVNICQTPGVQQVLLENNCTFGLLRCLPRLDDRKIYREMFRKLVEWEPLGMAFKALQKGSYISSPLEKQDLLPLLTHEDDQIRQKALRAFRQIREGQNEHTQAEKHGSSAKKRKQRKT